LTLADIVNLKLARKRRDRVEKEQQAEQNRQKFGRSKADRQTEAASKALESRKLDGHKLEE
jgi:hypothetical protein